MKKIMFNEHYGLETATLNGSKTRTSRLLRLPKTFRGIPVCGFTKHINGQGDWYTTLYDEDERNIDDSYVPFTYLEGEIVAVAQRYKDIFSMGWKSELTGDEVGWHNKMFVKSEYMPHQIQITDVKLEHLQDISNEDCIKEGIIDMRKYCIPKKYAYKENGDYHYIFDTPREAFASLIDRVSGKGTWDKNPWVAVYYYKLIQ
jgi:hypothetical protein